MNDEPSEKAPDEYGTLVILKSANGRDNWVPVLPAEVPEWIKDLDVMGRLVNGEACMDATTESGTDWFIAVPAADIAALQGAQAKREMRQAKRVVH